MVVLVETRNSQLPYALSEHVLSTDTPHRYKLLAANQKLCYYFQFQLWIILPNIITLTEKKENEMDGHFVLINEMRNENKFCVSTLKNETT